MQIEWLASQLDLIAAKMFVYPRLFGVLLSFGPLLINCGSTGDGIGGGLFQVGSYRGVANAFAPQQRSVDAGGLRVQREYITGLLSGQ